MIPVSSLVFVLHSSSLFLQAKDIKCYKSNMGRLWVDIEDFILPYSAAGENSDGTKALTSLHLINTQTYLAIGILLL